MSLEFKKWEKIPKNLDLNFKKVLVIDDREENLEAAVEQLGQLCNLITVSPLKRQHILSIVLR